MIDGLTVPLLIFYSTIATYNWILTYVNNKHIRDMQHIEEEVHRICHHTAWRACSDDMEAVIKELKKHDREKEIREL